MASEMVEKLAKKWSRAPACYERSRTDPKGLAASCNHEAQWWLIAIADELEREKKAEPFEFQGPVARWLRAQAGEAGDD